MNQIPQLLERWSAKEPTVCKRETQEDGDVYHIGEYCFWSHDDGVIVAIHEKTYNDVLGYPASRLTPTGLHYNGQPALDWLEGCVRRAIEAQGLDWEMKYLSSNGQINAEVTTALHIKSVWNNIAIEALLTAYIEYLEGLENE